MRSSIGCDELTERKLFSEKQVNELLLLVKELTPKLNAYLRSIGSLETKRRLAPSSKTRGAYFNNKKPRPKTKD